MSNQLCQPLVRLRELRLNRLAYQQRWARGGIGECCRQEVREIINQSCYIEVRINIRGLAFGSRDSLACECVMAPWEDIHRHQTIESAYHVS